MEKEFDLIIKCVLEQRLNIVSVLNFDKDIKYNEKELLRLAYEHKAQIALFQSNKMYLDILSSNSNENLKKNVAISLSNRTLMQKKLNEIIKAFINKDVTPLLIKGPASSLQLYNNPTIREYTDIDLVIDSKDFHQVCPIMESLGYIEKNNNTNLNNYKKNESIFMKKIKMHHLIFTNPNTPFRIEIHNEFFSDLSHPIKYNTTNIIKRCEIIKFNEINYYSPNLKDHALLLILHGTKHAWMVIHWIIDIIALFSIKDDELHKSINEGVIELNLQKHVALIIAIIKDFYDFDIPNPYILHYNKYKDTLKKQKKIAKTKLINYNLCSQSIWQTLSFSINYQSKFALKKKDKFKIIINPFLISESDYKFLKLPNYLMWIHLLLRPFFVINRRLNRNRKNNNEKK